MNKSPSPASYSLQNREQKAFARDKEGVFQLSKSSAHLPGLLSGVADAVPRYLLQEDGTYIHGVYNAREANAMSKMHRTQILLAPRQHVALVEISLWEGASISELVRRAVGSLLDARREAVLDAYLFYTLAEVQAITLNWLEEYNAIRPHEALGDISPYQFAPYQP